MHRCLRMLSALAASAPLPGSGEFAMPELAAPPVSAARPLKVLLVVAHPDDESECAATLYRITHELHGVVDQMVITNGAGGQHFSGPALDYYGVAGKKNIGRRLARLRRNELLRAGRVIGIRRHYFLNQTDAGYTADAGDGFRRWDLKLIRRELDCLLRRERYDVVLTLLPSRDTHGHHKTVAVLALEAAHELPAEARPALVGVRTGASDASVPVESRELDGFPQTRTTTAQPVWSFDRRAPLAVNPALDHSIIVHWVIAEHKSQGMFQMEYGRRTHEHFWQFDLGGKRWEALSEPLMQPSRGPFAEAA